MNRIYTNKKSFVIPVILILLLLTATENYTSFLPGKNIECITYTMVNATYDSQQGDAHVLRFTNGSVYVIDTGPSSINSKNGLVSFLGHNKIRKIDKLFISHAHKDHYEGIFDMINAGIQIKAVYFNIPDKIACDGEKPWGCDYDHIRKTIEMIKKHSIPVLTLKAGDSFYPEKNHDPVLKVLAVFDGFNTPIGQTDINDTSAIMKFTYGKWSILFTGDLNHRLSTFLAKSSTDLKADILKVPHHGTEQTASNAFFDAVSPKLALVPAPKNLWLSERSKRIRDYFAQKNIPVLVSGIDGNITVLLYRDRYEIVRK